MRPPPIYMLAQNQDTARRCIENDLKDSRRRLYYVDRAERLFGHRDLVLWIHPTADMHPNYREIMGVARERGAILIKIDDSYAREAYNRKYGPVY